MGMTPRLSSETLIDLFAAANALPDAEICGLLLAGEGEMISRPANNVAADPTRFFEIDPAALIAAHRAVRKGGQAIIGHYHSHPSGDPEPSRADAADAVPDGSLWLIVTRDRARLWRAVPHGGVHGRFDAVAFDCITGNRLESGVRTVSLAQNNDPLRAESWSLTFDD